MGYSEPSGKWEDSCQSIFYIVWREDECANKVTTYITVSGANSVETNSMQTKVTVMWLGRLEVKIKPANQHGVHIQSRKVQWTLRLLTPSHPIFCDGMVSDCRYISLGMS